MMTFELFEKELELLKDLTPKYHISFTKLSREDDLWDFRLNFRNYASSIPFKKYIPQIVDQMIFYLKKEISLKKLSRGYLQILFEELVKSIESFTELEVRGNKFYFQPNAEIFLNDATRVDYTIGNVNESYLKEIIGFSNIRYESLIKLKDVVEELVFSDENENTNKLELKISVADIALLFRLLDDEKMIEYKHKTEIYRFIASSFKTENQDNISESSIKNKFLTPDNSSIGKMDILLVRFRQLLKNYQ